MISPISMSDNLPQSTKLLYIMFIFFFNSTRLGCVQNLVTRQHFILYIWTFEGLFLVILSFDTSIVLLSIKAFSNQLIKPWIFNQLSPRVLYFAFFFSASVTRLHNCIGPELVPADLDTRELNHNRSKFFIKSTLKQVISCISGEQALEFSLLSLQGKSAQYSKTPLVFSVVYLRCFAYVSVNSKD